MTTRIGENTVVTGLAPVALSSVTPDYVSLKNWGRCQVVIALDCGGSTAASTISLLQATAVAGTGEKALGFTTYWYNTDTAAGDTLTKGTASSDTFDTGDTDNKNELYVIDVDASDLDAANDFDCLSVSVGDAANTDGAVLYILSEPRYGETAPKTAITD